MKSLNNREDKLSLQKVSFHVVDLLIKFLFEYFSFS